MSNVQYTDPPCHWPTQGADAHWHGIGGILALLDGTVDHWYYTDYLYLGAGDCLDGRLDRYIVSSCAPDRNYGGPTAATRALKPSHHRGGHSSSSSSSSSCLSLRRQVAFPELISLLPHGLVDNLFNESCVDPRPRVFGATFQV